MAIDSRSKRASAVSTLGWSVLASPAPDGTVGAEDRPHVSHVYSGFAEADVTVTPTPMHLILTGHAPTIFATEVVEPGTLHLVINGHAPTVFSTTVIAVPDTLHLVIRGYEPTLVLPQIVTPETMHLVIRGHVPFVALPITVTPDVLHLIISGHIPLVVMERIIGKGSTKELMRPGKRLYIVNERANQPSRQEYSTDERLHRPNRRLF